MVCKGDELMGKFYSGRFPTFTINDMCGSVKLYDIFQDGRVREKDAKTGQMEFVDPEYALAKLNQMIDYYTKCADKYKNASNYHKVYLAKIEIFKQMYAYVEERNK